MVDSCAKRKEGRKSLVSDLAQVCVSSMHIYVSELVNHSCKYLVIRRVHDKILPVLKLCLTNCT